MIDFSDRIALLADARVPGDARILALYLMELGEGPAADGWHEVPHLRFASLITGGASDETVRRHLRALEAMGWIEARRGGRDHSPKYRIVPRSEAGQNAIFRAALFSTMAPNASAGSIDSPTASRGEKDPPTGSRGYDPLSPTASRGDDARSRSRGTAVEVAGEEGAREVGSVENRYHLAPGAQDAIDQHGEKFAGCRGSLRDYLVARVQPIRQRGFVQTLAGWIDGIDPSVWKHLPDGGSLEPEFRTQAIAAALNELAATDESKMKRPEGDPGNLKTKLGILIKQRSDVWKSAPRAAAKGFQEQRDEAAEAEHRRTFAQRHAGMVPVDREGRKIDVATGLPVGAPVEGDAVIPVDLKALVQDTTKRIGPGAPA